MKHAHLSILSLVSSFLDSPPKWLLIWGIIISLFELLLLIVAARIDGTLRITNGIGLLNHYAIFTFLIGDITLLFFLRKYIDTAQLFRENLELTEQQNRIVENKIEIFKNNILMKNHSKFLYIFFFLIGLIFWISNLQHHISGNTVNQWGRITYDAFQFKWGFYCTRIHLFISWVLILPFFAFATIFSTLTLVTIIKEMDKKNILPFDILNNDKCGGYSFIGDAYIYFNLIISVCYIEVSSVVFISKEITLEQLLIYIFLTIALFLGNTIILHSSSDSLKRGRNKILNVYKQKISNSNYGYNFEIYKYCINEVGHSPFTKYSKNMIRVTKLLAFAISLSLQIGKILTITKIL